MKTLYARFVLWLIRPALDLRLAASGSVPTFDATDLGSLAAERRLSTLDSQRLDAVGQQEFYESMVALHSADGKAWTIHKDGRLIVSGASDLQQRLTRAVRDAIRGQRPSRS
ncbi:hypothetical protein [Burkholderia gladioli]|uniref:hypothetical protein n=1 Tax=Burkholderia gladioli TaxID=28095 RepID=UPI0016404AD3|nr:hypothetical protein [Burkholderia gladioli]